MKDLLTVIVPAAGAGKRMGFGKNKAFITIRDIPLLVLCMKMLAFSGFKLAGYGRRQGTAGFCCQRSGAGHG